MKKCGSSMAGFILSEKNKTYFLLSFCFLFGIMFYFILSSPQFLLGFSTGGVTSLGTPPFFIKKRKTFSNFF